MHDLARLLETPTDARLLAPLVDREDAHHLPAGPLGDRGRPVAHIGREHNRIARSSRANERLVGEPPFRDGERLLGVPTESASP